MTKKKTMRPEDTESEGTKKAEQKQEITLVVN